MKKGTKKTIKLITNSMLTISIVLLIISASLVYINLGFGLEMQPPLCWASFLQMGLFMLMGWAFNKELFYY